MLCYMPTVGLASATAFHLVNDKEKEFPIIRLFGTFGWIVAGIIVSFFLHGDTTPLPMYVAGIAGILMGFYSFTLPNVPPQGEGKGISFRDIIGIDALRQLSSPSFIIFIIGAMHDTVINPSGSQCAKSLAYTVRDKHKKSLSLGAYLTRGALVDVNLARNVNEVVTRSVKYYTANQHPYNCIGCAQHEKSIAKRPSK